MERLPKEVLYLISSYLNLPDRLCCLRVSKYFYNTFITVTYQELRLNTPDKFDNAFLLFNSKKKLGLGISNLTINSCELDDFTLLSLPDLFPNVKKLVWNSTSTFGPCYPSTYKRQLKKWKYIETAHITVHNRFDLSKYLFESSTFNNLRELAIRCYPSMSFSSTVLNSLISNLDSIPALWSLTLDCFTISIDDIESIHNKPNNLLRIILRDTEVGFGPNVDINTPKLENSALVDRHGNQHMIQPSERMRAFHLMIRVNLQRTTTAAIRRFEETIKNWIQYIGIKYPNLFAFSMVGPASIRNLFSVNDFEPDLINLISKLHNLTQYNTTFEKLTDPIRQVIEENDNIHLTVLSIWIDGRDANKQLNNLGMIKKLTRSLRELKLTDLAVQKRPDFQYAENMIHHLEQFQFLRKLDMKTTKNCGNCYSLLVNIIRNMPNLQILTFAEFSCDSLQDEPLLRIPTTWDSNISELALGVIVHRKGVRRDINEIFRFCLESCPMLTTFNLRGGLKCNWGNINLDFRENFLIQNVNINVNGCVFYTFNALTFKAGEFTPCDNYNVPITRSMSFLDPSEPLPYQLKNSFFINILHDQYISFNLANPSHRYLLEQ